ncbi:MAG: hypothetical protein EOM40_07145 [Clostridia bacterium]|nr:hypothetical protein [Clostridia bacterium]NCC42338.1 hypothetical protein [Clostridia bacterium]
MKIKKILAVLLSVSVCSVILMPAGETLSYMTSTSELLRTTFSVSKDIPSSATIQQEDAETVTAEENTPDQSQAVDGANVSGSAADPGLVSPESAVTDQEPEAGESEPKVEVIIPEADIESEAEIKSTQENVSEENVQALAEQDGAGVSNE